MKNLTWEYLEANAPDLIKNILEGLKQHKENPKYHPEGDAYTHIKTVIKRLEQTGDINLILAGFFHDLGKLEAAQPSDEGDFNTSYGHEDISSRWVMKYKDWIEELGGNPYIVEDIVKNHMKIKFDSFNKKERTRVNRQKDPVDNKTIFQKLNTFMGADNMNQDFKLDEARLKKQFKQKKPKYYHLWDLQLNNYLWTGRNSTSLAELKDAFIGYISAYYDPDEDMPENPHEWYKDINIIDLASQWELEIHSTDSPIKDINDTDDSWYPETENDYELITLNEARLKKGFESNWKNLPEISGVIKIPTAEMALQAIKSGEEVMITGYADPWDCYDEEDFEDFSDEQLDKFIEENPCYTGISLDDLDDYESEQEQLEFLRCYDNYEIWRNSNLQEARLRKQFKPDFQYQPFIRITDQQYGDNIWGVKRKEFMDWLDNYGINNSSIQDMADEIERNSIVIDFVDDMWRVVEPEERERVWVGVENDLKDDLIRMKVSQEISITSYYNPFENDDNLLTLRVTFNRPYTWVDGNEQLNEARLKKTLRKLKSWGELKPGDYVKALFDVKNGRGDENVITKGKSYEITRISMWSIVVKADHGRNLGIAEQGGRKLFEIRPTKLNEVRLKKDFKISVGDKVIFGFEFIHDWERKNESLINQIRNEPNEIDKSYLKDLLDVNESDLDFLYKHENIPGEILGIQNDIICVSWNGVEKLMPLRYFNKFRDLSEAEIKIKPELNEEIQFEYLSDGIRYDALKDALADEFWNDDEHVLEADLQDAKWLTMVLNKKDYLDYYELFVQECWDALYQKEEYNGLSNQDAIYKLVTDRFTKIADALGLIIQDWLFDGDILNIEFKKTPKTTLLNEVYSLKALKRFDVKNNFVIFNFKKIPAYKFIDKNKDYISYIILTYNGQQLKYYPKLNTFYIVRRGEQVKGVDLSRVKYHTIYMNNDWITGLDIERLIKSKNTIDIKEINGLIYHYIWDPDIKKIRNDVYRINKETGELEDYFLSEAKLKKRFKDYPPILNNSFELQELLIAWLIDAGYAEDSAEDQIKNAKINVEGDVVTIIYNNNVQDIVRITGKNVEDVQQLAEARLKRSIKKSPTNDKKTWWLWYGEYLPKQILTDPDWVKAYFEDDDEKKQKFENFQINNDYDSLAEWLFEILDITTLDEIMDIVSWDGSLNIFVYDNLNAWEQLELFNKLTGETYEYYDIHPIGGSVESAWSWDQWDEYIIDELKNILHDNYHKISEIYEQYPEFFDKYKKTTTLFEARLKGRLKMNWGELIKWVRSDRIKNLKHPKYNVSYDTISWDIIDLDHYTDNPDEQDIQFNFNRYKKYWNETYGLTSFEKEELRKLQNELHYFLIDEYNKQSNLTEARTKVLPRHGTVKIGPVLVKFQRHFDDKGEFDPEGEYQNKITLKYEIDGYGPQPEQEDFKSSEVYWKEFDKFIELLKPYTEEIEEYFRSRGYSLWSY